MLVFTVRVPHLYFHGSIFNNKNLRNLLPHPLDGECVLPQVVSVGACPGSAHQQNSSVLLNLGDPLRNNTMATEVTPTTTQVGVTRGGLGGREEQYGERSARTVVW